VLLLVHGRTWSGVPDFDLQVEGGQRSLMDALVSAGWASYAVDLRGYGGTPRDDTGWLTPDRAATDVEAVLDWIAKQRPMDKKPALFGWSRGSMVAQLCAQRHPELISDLVLFGYPTNPDAKRKKASPAVKPPKKATTAKSAASDFISPNVIDQETIDAYVAASLAADPIRTDWKDEHEFNVLDPSKVSVPTLVMHGERDPFAPLKNQAKLFSRLGHPDRRWVIIAGGDHAAHLEDTLPQFLDGLLGFLERPPM
jgi:pimeloyl-ACP methyl ester carboxylesterase